MEKQESEPISVIPSQVVQDEVVASSVSTIGLPTPAEPEPDQDHDSGCSQRDGELEHGLHLVLELELYSRPRSQAIAE